MGRDVDDRRERTSPRAAPGREISGTARSFSAVVCAFVCWTKRVIVARVKGQGNDQNKKASVIDISFYGHNTPRCGQHRIESTIRPIATLFFTMCLVLRRCSTRLKQLDYESRLPRDCTMSFGLEDLIEAIHVYDISRGLSCTATAWDEISGSHPHHLVFPLDSPFDSS